MTTEEVYRHFGTPKNLQSHMLTVSGLICLVKEHWIGDEINWRHLITAGLLHDLGNVIKFDLDKFPALLGDELPRIDFWREEQKRLVAKYGNDDHVATGIMLDELGVNSEIKNVVQLKSFSNILQIAKSNNWLPKILQYCDLRTAPVGLVTLDERMNDIRERYSKYAHRADFLEMIEAGKAIEREIAQNVDENPEEIFNQNNVMNYKQELLLRRVST